MIVLIMLPPQPHLVYLPILPQTVSLVKDTYRIHDRRALPLLSARRVHAEPGGKNEREVPLLQRVSPEHRTLNTEHRTVLLLLTQNNLI